MKFAPLAGLCVGLAMAASPGLAQTAGTPGQQPASGPSGAKTPPPAPERSVTPETPAISHEEMVKEQERRDREAEAERDRDDQ